MFNSDLVEENVEELYSIESNGWLSCWPLQHYGCCAARAVLSRISLNQNEWLINDIDKSANTGFRVWVNVELVFIDVRSWLLMEQVKHYGKVECAAGFDMKLT